MENFNVDEIKKINLYEIIADKIEDMLVDDMNMVGKKLPAEQNVADKFNVSRNVVREAFKILRERGLIEVKNGDGAYVVRPEPQILTKTIKRIVIMNNIDYRELYELRYALEITSCKLTIQRMTPEKIQTFGNILESMEKNLNSQTAWSKYDLDFHRFIIKSTDNKLLYSFYKPIVSSLLNIFTTSWELPGAKEKGHEAHKKLMDAFVTRNEELAVKYLEAHLNESMNDITMILKTKDKFDV